MCQPRDSELIKLIGSDIKDSCHRGLFEKKNINVGLIQVSNFWPTWASSVCWENCQEYFFFFFF